MTTHNDLPALIASLDTLTPVEMLTLQEQITARLKALIEIEDDDGEAPSEGITRRYFPRLPQMITWGLVKKTDDTLYVAGRQDQPALLIDASRVAYQGQTMGINDWAKLITGWKAVNVYEFVVVKRTGQTLDEMRRVYMQENGLE